MEQSSFRLLRLNPQRLYTQYKEGTLRTLVSFMILCGLMLNLGCQADSMETSPDTERTANPTSDSSSTPIPTEADMQNLINQAMADLAGRLGVDVNEIILLEMTSVVWPDGSLGCPREGMVYAQVLTPGYLIRLQSGDQIFEYHASRGTTVIFCENPSPPVPGTPADT